MTGNSTELENAYFDSIRELKEGEIVEGQIVAVTPREVIVDVGYKSEGIIFREEFVGVKDLEKLDKIEVFVENVEDEEGKVILSYRKAQEVKGWSQLVNEFKEGDLVEGVVSRKVKGGFMVNVFGVEGFLPQSLSTFKGSEFNVVGEKFYFQILKLSKTKSNFIVSRKDAIRLEKEMARKTLWESLKIGEVRKGKVKSVTNFGAFVDLGGVDGLLHIADMSWKKVSHPSEVVAVGDEIQVMILSYDQEKGKISLGLKQMMPDPWLDIDKKYNLNSVIKGKVVNIQNYGVFLELEKGIEGLVHISEISWSKKFLNLNELFAIGDIIEAKIIGIDVESRKISLSIKQIEKDPWDEIESMVTIDSQIQGKIVGFGEGCAYVELDNGLEGIIYNEDISWTKRVLRAQEMLKRSHTYEVKVLGLDRTNRRVIVGIKQLIADPWNDILEKYPLGTVIDGEVVKVTNFGVFVKIEEELEGLVFAGEMEKATMDSLKPRDTIKAKIIKIDPASAKIGLSTKIDEQDQTDS
ncbi:MAG: S1 RNA-binding domain-containing protein [Candidatus Omnitrophica bacterium]|nr:S1 RNA-binding domain-containing protein [Candidatus Omnitrophota bacterium]